MKNRKFKNRFPEFHPEHNPKYIESLRKLNEKGGYHGPKPYIAAAEKAASLSEEQKQKLPITLSQDVQAEMNQRENDLAKRIVKQDKKEQQWETEKQHFIHRMKREHEIAMAAQEAKMRIEFKKQLDNVCLAWAYYARANETDFINEAKQFTAFEDFDKFKRMFEGYKLLWVKNQEVLAKKLGFDPSKYEMKALKQLLESLTNEPLVI